MNTEKNLFQVNKKTVASATVLSFTVCVRFILTFTIFIAFTTLALGKH